jgi:hypothetical protein
MARLEKSKNINERNRTSFTCLQIKWYALNIWEELPLEVRWEKQINTDLGTWKQNTEKKYLNVEIALEPSSSQRLRGIWRCYREPQ